MLRALLITLTLTSFACNTFSDLEGEHPFEAPAPTDDDAGGADGGGGEPDVGACDPRDPEGDCFDCDACTDPSTCPECFRVDCGECTVPAECPDCHPDCADCAAGDCPDQCYVECGADGTDPGRCDPCDLPDPPDDCTTGPDLVDLSEFLLGVASHPDGCDAGSSSPGPELGALGVMSADGETLGLELVFNQSDVDEAALQALLQSDQGADGTCDGAARIGCEGAFAARLVGSVPRDATLIVTVTELECDQDGVEDRFVFGICSEAAALREGQCDGRFAEAGAGESVLEVSIQELVR